MNEFLSQGVCLPKAWSQGERISTENEVKCANIVFSKFCKQTAMIFRQNIVLRLQFKCSPTDYMNAGILKKRNLSAVIAH